MFYPNAKANAIRRKDVEHEKQTNATNRIDLTGRKFVFRVRGGEK